MKKLFVILAVATVLVGCNTNRCEIVGRLDNFEAIGYVYLTDMWDMRSAFSSRNMGFMNCTTS